MQPCRRRAEAATVGRVLVCHPERLLAEAVAAALLADGTAADAVALTSPAGVLSRVGEQAGTAAEVALVSASIGADLRELLDALWFRRRALPVLVLSHTLDLDAAARELEWGAVGSVHHAAALPRLRRAIADARDGRVVFLDDRAEEILARLHARRLERAAAGARLAALTHREGQVLRALADGAAPAEIGRRLHLSVPTIRTCIRDAGQKLDAQGQLRIAAVARELLATAQPPSDRFLQLRVGLRR